MCYIGHITSRIQPCVSLAPGSREKHPTGAWQFRAQAVSQKTRKKSVSKGSKKAAAVSRGATKSRARASLKDPRKASKASAAKSSKNKRSAMPSKTAKTAAKATVSKAPASKVAVSKTVDLKHATPKAAVKPVAAKPAPAKPVAAAPRVEEPKKVLTQRQGFKTNEFVVYPAHGVGQILAIEEQEIAGAKLELDRLGGGDLRGSGLHRRLRGSFCSLAGHCASFVFGGFGSRGLAGLPGFLERSPGTAFGCTAGYRSGFLRTLGNTLFTRFL